MYGGTVDVVSGELTADVARSLISALNWTKGNRNTANTGNIFYARLYGVIDYTKQMWAEVFKYIPYTYPNWEELALGEITVVNGDYILCCADYSTKDDFLTALGSSAICYMLLTPTTYQLTPTQVALLLGTNNVWCDTGDTQVTYKADVQRWVQKQLS